MHPNNSRGFTGIELLITLSILMIIFAIGFVSFRSFRDTQTLQAGVFQTAALVEQARAASIASKEDSSYGVHFETSRAVYFKGISFSEPSSSNKEIIFDGAIEISAIALAGGGVDVRFGKLTGETEEYGTVTFRARGDTEKTRTLIIQESGLVTHQ